MCQWLYPNINLYGKILRGFLNELRLKSENIKSYILRFIAFKNYSPMKRNDRRAIQKVTIGVCEENEIGKLKRE